MLPKIFENKMCKMKISEAAQTFSHSMYAALMVVSETKTEGRMSPKCEETAHFIKFMDRVFDSVNSSLLHLNVTKEKPIVGQATRTSGHSDFWHKAIRVFDYFIH